jgi:P27 family predicted phage terminase small subunit
MVMRTVPKEAKVRRGTYRKDRDKAVIIGVDVIPLERVTNVENPAPAHLGAVGAREWDYVLRTCPWIAPSDLSAVQFYCEAVDRRDDFSRELAGGSLMLETSTGYAYINPAFVGMRQCEEQIVKWMSLLGMTPSDRTRLGVAEVKAKSELEKLAERRSQKLAEIEAAGGLPGSELPSVPKRPRRATARSSSTSSTPTAASPKTASPDRPARRSTRATGSGA